MGCAVGCTLSPRDKIPMTPRVSSLVGDGKIMRRFVVDDFEKDVIGEGAFSTCYKAYDSFTDQFVALKKYKSQTDDPCCSIDALTLHRFKRQVAVLKELAKPFVQPTDPTLWCEQLASANPSDLFVNMIEYSKDANGEPGPNAADGVLYIVTELAQYSLEKFIRQQRKEFSPLPKAYVQSLAKQIILVVAGLHAKGFVHLDLKPENIMRFTNGHLKLIDVDGCFRAGTDLDRGDPSASFSPCYCAPEWAGFLLKNEKSQIRIAPSIDVWSVGVTICELVNLQRVLADQMTCCTKESTSHAGAVRQFLQWLSALKTFPLPEKVSRFDTRFHDLLTGALLVPEAKRRKTLAECLSSSFIAESAELKRLPFRMSLGTVVPIS